VNFCQPPLLAPPALAADPALLLPRASEFWLKRWKPLLELVFEPEVELVLAPAVVPLASRPLPADLVGVAVLRNDTVLLRPEKKCWFSDTFRVVDAAAARPLAE
jgi:hypothetical protein